MLSLCGHCFCFVYLYVERVLYSRGAEARALIPVNYRWRVASGNTGQWIIIPSNQSAWLVYLKETRGRKWKTHKKRHPYTNRLGSVFQLVPTRDRDIEVQWGIDFVAPGMDGVQALFFPLHAPQKPCAFVSITHKHTRQQTRQLSTKIILRIIKKRIWTLGHLDITKPFVTHLQFWEKFLPGLLHYRVQLYPTSGLPSLGKQWFGHPV